MFLDATPIKDGLPKTIYDAKRLVLKLGLKAKRIDCCVDGCILCYDNDIVLTEVGTSNKKSILVKAMFYFPIIPRLQRLFTWIQTASQMSWCYENRRSSGMLRHPFDGEAWKHFDRVHADFVDDPWNVWLGLCTDGFNLYIQASSLPYSYWSIIVIPYNLPPEMCLTKPYMFLSCVILGPFNVEASFMMLNQDWLKLFWW